MKFYFAFVLLILYFIPVCLCQTCSNVNDLFGVISETTSKTITTCWKIKVPENMYIRVEFAELSLQSSPDCSKVSLEITVIDTGEVFTFCYNDNSYKKPVTALSDIKITFSNYAYSGRSTFSVKYHTEDLICAQRNHFRCSKHKCIPSYKVCDRVKDCENGLDEEGCETGILSVKGLNESRKDAISWLLKNRKSYGWGINTHRAVTALYLAQGAYFRGQNLEEELMAKELALQTSVVLLRNSTNPVSVSELSMFINALSATCHNPRRFFGHDLVRVLGERVSVSAPPSPRAYLTLCNLNWKLTETDIHRLVQLLSKHSKYPFTLDVQAVTVMALTCIKNVQENEFKKVHNSSHIYNQTVEKFIKGQHSDGSFGSIYATALVSQALIASGQEYNSKWNVTSTILYLMKELNSTSVDFLSAYLTLPIFSAKSLVDMASIDCSNFSRKLDEDNEISDVMNKLGGELNIQYSLYIGDRKDVIHTIYLKLHEETSAFDIMRIAQVADPKYKFRHGHISGHMYIYEIAGIINDPEAGKFWLMYSEDSNKTIGHFTESPDKFLLGDGEHLIMWYKTAHI